MTEIAEQPVRAEKIPLTHSPLLSKPIIEKAYTHKTSSSQQQAAQPSNPPPETPPAEPVAPSNGHHPDESAHSGGQPTIEPPSPGGFADTHFEEPHIQTDPNIPEMEFTNPLQQEAEFGGDMGGGPADGGGMDSTVEFSPEQAESFSRQAAELLDMYVIPLLSNRAKVDVNNLRLHVAKGNLQPQFINVFEDVNKNTAAALKMQDQEKANWAKSLKDFLTYKKIKAANPETAFYATTLALFGRITIDNRQAQKKNEDLVMQAIKASNPGGFSSPAEAQEAKDKFDKETAGAPGQPEGGGPGKKID